MGQSSTVDIELAHGSVGRPNKNRLRSRIFEKESTRPVQSISEIAMNSIRLFTKYENINL